MPEIRRASQHFSPENVQFGTIDCTLHNTLCSREGVTAYPTTVLYNGSKTHHFHGMPNEQSIVEFVQDMLNPLGRYCQNMYKLSVTHLGNYTLVCLMVIG